MGKRLGQLKQGRRNTYTGDEMYVPQPNLKFRAEEIEIEYQKETFRFSTTSLKCFTHLMAGITVLIWAHGHMGVVLLVLTLLSLYASLQALPHGPFVTRLAWVVPDTLMVLVLSGPRFAHCFCALLPSFCARKFHSDLFSYKHWSHFLLIALGESVFVSWIVDASGWRLMEAACALTFVAALLERENRDLWVLFDSFRRSEELQYRLFEESPSAEFILADSGKIVTANAKAKQLLKKLNKPVSILKSGCFQELFAEEFTSRFQDMIAAAMRDEEDEEELFLKPLPSKLDEDVLCDLAIGVKFQPTIWKNGNYIRVTCSDISPFMSRRLFLMQLYRGLYGSIYNFLRNFQRLYQCAESVQKEDVYDYSKISSMIRNTLVLQSYFIGRIELKKETYHIKNEITSQLESAAVRAVNHGVVLSVSKDSSMPLSVSGDRNKHNQLLGILLDFALEHAIKDSEVKVHCTVVRPTQATEEGQTLAMYRVAFNSQKIGQRELDKLFATRKKDSSRKSLQEIVGITAKFGVGLAVFDTLLTVMRGCVKDAYASSETKQKVVVAYEIPLQEATMERRPMSPVLQPLSGRSKAHMEESKSDSRLIHKAMRQADEARMMQASLAKEPAEGPTAMSEAFQFSRKASSDVQPLPRIDDTFREDDISEFPGNSVEAAIRGHVLTASCHAHSATVADLRGRRSRYSRRNPASAQLPEYQNPLEAVRRRTFSTDTADAGVLEQNPLKVLLVEHNKFSREATKILIAKQTGCEPDLARDGKEAFDMFSAYASQGRKYFVIFMDIVMPKADVVEATLAIRRLEQERSYHRTFICGMVSSEVPPDAGMDSFSKHYSVQKPLQETQIAEVFTQARRAVS